MAPAFSKEAVLQGSIDHLCLVCESYLRSESDVGQHVSTAEHKENLSKTDYVDKYKNDRIRKVKNRYFCEFCNVLVSTLTAVALHVEETKHVENKSTQRITKVGDVIVSGNITIHEDAWHGLINEKTCTICDLEFEDKDVHKNELTHIINLIQCEGGQTNSIYRTIGDSIFHCLTCNEVVVDINAHLRCVKHNDNIKTITSKQEEDANKAPGNTKTIPSKQGEDTNKDPDNKCCNTLKDNKIYIQHQAQSDGNVKETFDDEKTTVELPNSSINSNARISSAVKNIDETIDGKLHNTSMTSYNKAGTSSQNKIIVKANTKMCNFQRVPSVRFITVIASYNFFNYKDIVLNEKYCINYHCFTFLTNIKKGHVRCQVCEVNLLKRDIKEHVSSIRHITALLTVPVIIWNESEFIREIRSGIFQCGFCNIIQTWEGMENHLKSTVHDRNKRSAHTRATRYLLTRDEDCMDYEFTNALLMMFSLHENFYP